MNILMTGGTGLIGQELGQKLVEAGHKLKVVTRNASSARLHLTYPCELIECDLNTTPLSTVDFAGVQTLVNLAGETVDGRWTKEKKNRIQASRLQIAENLMLNCPHSVTTVITASAQGFYGNRGDTDLDEESENGEGFLAEVCKHWESQFQNIKNKRVVILRIGLVLSKKGGALRKLISVFQNNLGARLGNGQQWMSFISLNDLTRLFVKTIEENQWQGVVNAVNNKPIQNKEFTNILCKALGVRQLPPVPGFVLKTTLGEMSDLVLASLKVYSKKMSKMNFKFADEDLDLFLTEELKHHKDACSVFYNEQFIHGDINKIFDFFSDAYNLEKLTPEILNFKITNVSDKKITTNTLIDYQLKIHGLPIKWKTQIEAWKPPFEFVDNQLKGPYAKWHHTHTFKTVTGGVLMTDLVRYKLPVGFLGKLVAGGFVDSDISQIFSYRRKVIGELSFNAN